MGYLFIKGYIYFINIFVFGGLLSYWGILFWGFLFWGFSWVFWAMGLGVLGFCGRKLYISI
jgi:hypothetical protein